MAPTDLNLGALVEAQGKVYAFKQVFDGFASGFPLGHSQVVMLDLKTGKAEFVAHVDASIGPIFGAVPVR